MDKPTTEYIFTIKHWNIKQALEMKAKHNLSLRISETMNAEHGDYGATYKRDDFLREIHALELFGGFPEWYAQEYPLEAKNEKTRFGNWVLNYSKWDLKQFSRFMEYVFDFLAKNQPKINPA